MSSHSCGFCVGEKTIKPVSYTHLDVYKRQVQIDVAGSQSLVRGDIVRECLDIDSQTPVSYTHLDVYKRQTLICPSGEECL